MGMITLRPSRMWGSGLVDLVVQDLMVLMPTPAFFGCLADVKAEWFP